MKTSGIAGLNSFVVAIALLALGCGNSELPAGESTLSRFEESPDNDPDGLAKGGEQRTPLLCLSYQSSDQIFQANAGVFLTAEGIPRPEFTKIKINRFVLTGQNQSGATVSAWEDPDFYIQFFRIQVRNSSANLDPKPLEFYFEDLNNFRISPYINRISAIELSRIQKQITDTKIVIRGTDLDQDVLRVQAYQGQNRVWSFDGLLPYIDSNPHYYALGKNPTLGLDPRPRILVEMHPFFHLMDRVKEDASFATMAQDTSVCP